MTNGDGETHAGEGWTCLVVTPQRGLRAVDFLLTGFHEPEASHLAILETLASLSHIEIAYQQAVGNGYLWHEFGDLHLICHSPVIARRSGATTKQSLLP